MSRITLTAPIDAAEVMGGAPFVGGRHRQRNLWVKKVKISMVVALAFGVLSAGTTFAVPGDGHGIRSARSSGGTWRGFGVAAGAVDFSWPQR
jgi:hypothetical protein